MVSRETRQRGFPAAACAMCHNVIAGSTLIDISDARELASVYLLHIVDEHWPIVERIRATTGDATARGHLVQQLAIELDL